MRSFKLKFWLEKGGKALLGEGRAKLLELIDNYKSLAKASRVMKMSYRSAWGSLKKLEARACIKIIKARRGGKAGGITELTEKGKKLLEFYKERRKILERALKFPAPALTVDGIVSKGNQVLLVKRKREPFKGRYAIPGGFVDYNERVEEAVVRELKEETGLITKPKSIVGVYSSPTRDPRCHTVSIVYELEVVGGKLKKAREEVQELRFFSLDSLPKLAFDHNLILENFKARNRVKVKLECRAEKNA
ncbi:MAG: NUDIX domain-containing protein [Candidatus Thermoplasmatota archaeon]|nr:NUDIX domain-containing protein [Candidatus Thermoplasmatota archaeon]MDI6887150.1 NUDIX domain-containing protein [Candidatus Thermoplasmatota archaeon]